MLYEGWWPNVEDEGTSVFLQKYEKRGENQGRLNNERKKIYYSALTPDLYDMYAGKIKIFLDKLFDQQNAGEPLMKLFQESYFDMYWDLHLGVKEHDIPDFAREIGRCFINVAGFWFPMLQNVRDDYMRVRALREDLKGWIDERLQLVRKNQIQDPEKTFVYYWDKNSDQGTNPNFQDKDIIFECFHNFIAFSQWSHMLYRIMERLDEENEDAADVQEWFKETMRLEAERDPNDIDTPAFTPEFTPLDRFVMELFRTISPNEGSVSTLDTVQQYFGTGYPGFSTMITPHPETSRAHYHWINPDEFDPNRYKTAQTSDENNIATTSVENDDKKRKEIGLARCPFSKESFPVKDDRPVKLTNSGFGAVYPEIDGEAYPVCDDAGYAPFGFGYRRCAGEFLTVGFFKDLLTKVSKENIRFRKLTDIDPVELAVAPVTVVKDNIGFERAAATSAS
jgi:cytochrome P450